MQLRWKEITFFFVLLRSIKSGPLCYIAITFPDMDKFSTRYAEPECHNIQRRKRTDRETDK